MYGDGYSDYLLMRFCGGVLKDFVDMPLTLLQSLFPKNSLKRFSIMYSPSPCTKMSTNGYLSKKPRVSSGTCGPPKTMIQLGFCFFTSLASSVVSFQFQT